MATIPTFVLTYGANPYKRSESILGLSEAQATGCLLYTSDAADERSSVDLGGRRIIKKKTHGKEERQMRETIEKHSEH